MTSPDRLLPDRTGTRWSLDDYAFVAEAVRSGHTVQQIADHLQRTTGAVAAAANRMLPPPLRGRRDQAFPTLRAQLSEIDWRQNVRISPCDDPDTTAALHAAARASERSLTRLSRACLVALDAGTTPEEVQAITRDVRIRMAAAAVIATDRSACGHSTTAEQ